MDCKLSWRLERESWVGSCTLLVYSSAVFYTNRKISAEELERKRQEMMENAKWREEERVNNLKKHRKEEELERELEKLDSRDGKFLQWVSLWCSFIGSTGHSFSGACDGINIWDENTFLSADLKYSLNLLEGKLKAIQFFWCRLWCEIICCFPL